MKKSIFLLLVNCAGICFSQAQFGIPKEGLIPEKLKNLPKRIVVQNFPKEVDPIKIKDSYYWKHNTLIFSKESPITIIEFGAYLFYNGKWNLRRSYPLKDLDKNFGTQKQVLLRAQPYTWNDNWRVGSQLYGGWALWYFIGIDKNGIRVCGYEKINTTNNLLN